MVASDVFHKEQEKKSLLLYVHIPFCPSKCHFCFKMQRNKGKQLLDDNLHDAYIKKLIKNIQFLSERYHNYRAIGINWGGGTPSVLSPEQVHAIGDQLSRYWPVARLPFSVEMTPDTVSEDIILAYKNLGCSRISLGIQTFNNITLRKMGRSHSKKDVEKSIELIRRCGIDNINLDLILALPGEDLSDNVETLSCTLAASVPHITTYFYHTVPESVLYRRLVAGRMHLWPTDKYLDAVKLAQDTLNAAGYQNYEYFHWSKQPDQYRYTCIDHYFGHKGDTLGFGAGAHSFISNEGNLTNNELDLFLLDPRMQSMGPFDIEYAIERALGCRHGVNYESIARTYGLQIDAVKEHALVKKIKTLPGVMISAEGITMSAAEYMAAHTLGVSRRLCH